MLASGLVHYWTKYMNILLNSFLRLLSRTQAKIKDTGEVVAIKKVFQDKRYKKRELQVMNEIGNHPNIIKLRNFYYTQGNNVSKIQLARQSAI